MAAYDPANPPQVVVPAAPPEQTPAQREKSALREAIFTICQESLGERGSRLLVLLDAIERDDGPKAAFDSLMKLMEFAIPKLQKVTVGDENGNPLQMPVINVTFAAPVAPPHVDAEVVEAGLLENEHDA